MLDKRDQNTEIVESTTASCSGYNAISKHPLIYLNLMKDQKITCPYCGKQFIHKHK